MILGQSLSLKLGIYVFEISGFQSSDSRDCRLRVIRRHTASHVCVLRNGYLDSSRFREPRRMFYYGMQVSLPVYATTSFIFE